MPAVRLAIRLSILQGMFSFDGKRSPLSRVAQSLLDNSSLKFNSVGGRAPTCVVYRKDPRDGYFFVTALAGIREREPMFGPFVHDDQRRDPLAKPDLLGFRMDQSTTSPNRLGFKAREGTLWHGAFENTHCRIHLSGRSSTR